MTINDQWEGCEVVYFHDMDRQVKARLDSLGRAVGSLKKTVASLKDPAAASPEQEPNAFKRYSWIVPWIVLFVGNGIFLYVLNSYIDSHVKTDVKAEIGQMPETLAQHTKKLAEIEGRLEEISRSLHAAEVRRVADLPESEFRKNLGDVKSVLAETGKNDRDPRSAPVREIRNKLQSTPASTPGLWEATAALINYTSKLPSLGLPDCLAAPPLGTVHLTNGSKEGEILTQPTYSNCEIKMDDPRAARVLSENLLSGRLILQNCVIVWGGGPIYLPANKTITITFTDCAFKIFPPNNPDPRGQSILAGLLRAANPSSASVVVN